MASRRRVELALTISKRVVATVGFCLSIALYVVCLEQYPRKLTLRLPLAAVWNALPFPDRQVWSVLSGQFGCCLSVHPWALE